MYNCYMLERNEELYSDVCKLKLKSVSGKPFSLLSDFIKIYSTPSRIKFKSLNILKKGGVEYNYAIKLFYPGLKSSDFLTFNNLINDRFLAKIFINKNVYEIGTYEIPLKMKTIFNSGKGTEIILKTKSIYPVKLSVVSQNLSDGFVYQIVKKF